MRASLRKVGAATLHEPDRLEPSLLASGIATMLTARVAAKAIPTLAALRCETLCAIMVHLLISYVIN
jgi:hypothetical protein